jgi:hypothetical protein
MGVARAKPGAEPEAEAAEATEAEEDEEEED